MKTVGKYEGLSGIFYDDPTAPDGKRWVCSAHHYKRLREHNRWQAGGRCEGTRDGKRCNRIVSLLMGEIHHVWGRGFGGSKREDRREVNGLIFTLWECHECHEREVILPWPPPKNLLEACR